jgi:hypothetical protein
MRAEASEASGRRFKSCRVRCAGVMQLVDMLCLERSFVRVQISSPAPVGVMQLADIWGREPQSYRFDSGRPHFADVMQSVDIIASGAVS